MQAIEKSASWEWDVVRNKIVYSPEFVTLLNLSSNTVESTVENFISLLHPDDQSLVNADLYTHLSIQNPFSIKVRFKCNDSYLLCRLQAQAIWIGNKAAGMLGIVKDISKEQQWFDTQQALFREIVETVRGKLAAILGSIRLISTTISAKPSSEIQNLQEMAQKNTDQLLNRIEDLLKKINLINSATP